MAPNMDNDEVIYNRQVVSVISHGGPQGYFGYQETHADIGRFGTWGPFLIWMYAIPGFLFGSSANTVFWCNLFLRWRAWPCCAGRPAAGVAANSLRFGLGLPVDATGFHLLRFL